MDKGLEQLVRRRSGGRCEYCHLPEAVSPIRHVCDHVVARQHLGPTTADNLALACVFCNRYKGPNLAGIDQQTGALTRLFNPRSDRWDDHFILAGAVIAGRTDIGRTTVQVLTMNDPAMTAIRQTLIDESH